MRSGTAILVAAIGTLLAGCAEVAPPAGPAGPLATPSRYKVVLVAGDPSIRAFDNATARLGAMLQSRAGVASGNIQRLSARDDVVAEGATLATAPAVLEAIRRMAPGSGEGCLVFATSHGSPRVGLDLPRLASQPNLAPAALDAALAHGCGEAPTVVVLSGCFSGEYLRGPLLRSNRVVISAARADRPSFGCGAGNVYTFFDECLLASMAATPAGGPWQAAMAATRECVTGRERGRFQPSEPQSWFGRAVVDLPMPWRS